MTYPETRAPRGIAEWRSLCREAVRAGTHRGFTDLTVRLVDALARYADHGDGRNIRPGWQLLLREVRCSRRALAYHLRYLHESGWLVTTEHGTRLSLTERRAAVYAARIPADHAHHQNSSSKNLREVEECTPPRVVTQEDNLTDTPDALRARTRTHTGARGSSPGDLSGTAARRRGSPAAGTARARRWELARRLQAVCALYRYVRTGRLVPLLREVAAQRWTFQDLLTWLDRAWTPTALRDPVAYLRWRMRDAVRTWPLPPSALAVQRALRSREDAVRLREQLTEQRSRTAPPDSPGRRAFTAARTALKTGG